MEVVHCYQVMHAPHANVTDNTNNNIMLILLVIMIIMIMIIIIIVNNQQARLSHYSYTR